jgi:hypothetical protein
VQIARWKEAYRRVRTHGFKEAELTGGLRKSVRASEVYIQHHQGIKYTKTTSVEKVARGTYGRKQEFVPVWDEKRRARSTYGETGMRILFWDKKHTARGTHGRKLELVHQCGTGSLEHVARTGETGMRILFWKKKRRASGTYGRKQEFVYQCGTRSVEHVARTEKQECVYNFGRKTSRYHHFEAKVGDSI